MHTAIEQNQTPPTETPKRYQCRHIFTDGRRCGSPCLRSEDLCYYHHTTRRPAQNPRGRRSRRSTFELPLPEDRSAIQHSIGQVLQRIAANDIDPRRAGLLLYGLQIASLNLPKEPATAKPAPETVEEITLDPELGILAPRAEVGQATRRKSTIAQLLETMLQSEQAPTSITEPTAQPTILPTLQATQSDSIPPNPKMHHLSHSNAPVEPLQRLLRTGYRLVDTLLWEEKFDGGGETLGPGFLFVPGSRLLDESDCRAIEGGGFEVFGELLGELDEAAVEGVGIESVVAGELHVVSDFAHADSY